ncbi:MAG: hypothetical protein BFD77_11205 [Pseudomonas sp. CO183]|nr:MAG: hypothetical protein BFD77_11205 [Pseudomonas sp. CO183]
MKWNGSEHRLTRLFEAQPFAIPQVIKKDACDFNDGRIRLPLKIGSRRFLVFRGIQPDALDWHCLLNDAKHRSDKVSASTNGFDDGRYRRVVIVDAIADAIFEPLNPPCLLKRRAGRDRNRRATESEYPSGSPSRILSQLSEPSPNSYRGPGSRFFNVNFPISIRGVRDIQPYPCKPMRFLSIPGPSLSKAQPTTCEKETAVPIYVETLLGSPAFRTARSTKRLLREAILMGENMTLSLDCP